MSGPTVPPKPDLDELRKLAAKATPGPWHREHGYAPCRVRDATNGLVADANGGFDAAYLAAVSPDVVLGLLAALDEARADAERLAAAARWYYQREARNGVNTTGNSPLDRCAFALARHDALVAGSEVSG